jgi:hypothetical protein
MSLVGCWIVLAFALKLCGVIAVARILDRRLNTSVGSLLGAWVLIQLSVTACMLALSSFQALTGRHLWLAIAILVAILACVEIVDSRRTTGSPSPLQFTGITGAERIAWLGTLAVFLFLLCRSLYFFDVTWDGLTYELSRISFWKSFHTLFIQLPTLQLNIFTNEWNGELNALYYALLAGNDQATSFGNAEIWLVGVAAYSWLAEGFGLTRKLTWVVGLALAATPLLLGLSVTVKGDLLACVALALAVGWLLRIQASSCPALAGFLSVASLGLAAGAKIVVWTSVPLLLLVVAAVLWRKGLTPGRWLLFGAASLAVFLTGVSRYLVNACQYGSFSPRIPGEVPALSLAHVSPNLSGLFLNIIDMVLKSPPGSVWMLNQGWGVTGVVLVVCLVLLPFGLRRSVDWIGVATAVVLSVGFLVTLIVLPWWPWTARYFAPWLFILAAFAIARGLRWMPDSFAMALGLSVVAAAALHLYMITRSGEAIPAPGVGIGMEMARNHTGLQRKLALHPYMLDGVGGLKGVGIERTRKSVLLLNQVDAATYPFWGDNSLNDVTLTDSASKLVSLASGKSYSLVVISGPVLPQGESAVWNALSAAGYQQVVNCIFWRIAVPSANSAHR